MTENATLESLVGQHYLTGVDMSNEKIATWGDRYEDANVIRFVLDGKTYTAVEDPSDSYRSSMASINVSNAAVSNKFHRVRVIGSMRGKGEYGQDCDIIDFRDAKNGKLVLSVGTDNTDDYYPSFVSDWQPENLSINEEIAK